MSIRRTRAVWISAAVLSVAVAGAALVQVSGASDTAPATTRSVASEAPSPAPSSSPVPSAPVPSTSVPSNPPTSSGPQTPGTAPPAGTPSAESVPVPPEMQPRDETLATGPSTLPPSEPLPDPVSLPFPDSASAEGKLVKGFPTRAIPPAPQSTVTNSSVASEGSRLQVTLSAESKLDVVEVLDFYRTEMAKVGLLDTPAPALSGSSALVFTRGDHTVTLSATADEGGSRYDILGSFVAPS